MLCCLGLFTGYSIGFMLGGPWTFTAPIIGFGIGFIADMKMMRGGRGRHGGFVGGYWGDEHAHNKKAEEVESPVRDMKADEKTTTHTAEFVGRTYDFSHRPKERLKKEAGEVL